MTGVKTRDTVTGEEDLLKTDGVFIFVGHLPNNELFPGKLEMDEDGHLITDRKHAHQRARHLCRRRDSGQGLQAGGDQRRPGLRRGHVDDALPGRPATPAIRLTGAPTRASSRRRVLRSPHCNLLLTP